MLLATWIGALGIGITACATAAPRAEHAATQSQSDAAKLELQLERWPAAEALFRSDPRWLGGDAAFSVDLGNDRILWLFGDSFVGRPSDPIPTQANGRRGSRMVRNSVAIQTGRDPATAKLRFFVPTDREGTPQSFFAEDDQSWLWPAHGMRVGESLVLFAHRMAPDSNPRSLGFKPVGRVALRVRNPDDEPSFWRVEPVALPEVEGGGLLGAAVVRSGDHIYAYGVRDPGDRALTLVRWPAAQFGAGDLTAPEVWTGPTRGFAVGAAAEPLIAPVSTELSVNKDPRGEGYVLVYSYGFGIAPIAMRFSRELTGPWSEPVAVDAPDVDDEPGARAAKTLVYAAKAHPAIDAGEGAEWTVTYVVSSLDSTRLFWDLSIYFPRVVRVKRSQRRAHFGRAHFGRARFQRTFRPSSRTLSSELERPTKSPSLCLQLRVRFRDRARAVRAPRQSTRAELPSRWARL